MLCGNPFKTEVIFFSTKRQSKITPVKTTYRVKPVK